MPCSNPKGCYVRNLFLVVQAMGGSLAEVEWEGILHWKTWALASLDCCISTTKCAILGDMHLETCIAGFASSCRHSGSYFAAHPGVEFVNTVCICCCRYALLVGFSAFGTVLPPVAGAVAFAWVLQCLGPGP